MRSGALAFRNFISTPHATRRQAHGTAAMAAEIVTENAEFLFQRRSHAIPHAYVAAERMSKHDYGCVLNTR